PPLPIVPGGPPVVEVHGNTSILGNLASNGVLAATDVQTNTLTVKTTGSINNLTVNNLAGSGDRFTVVDANGNLKTGGPVPQTICTVAPWCTAGNTGTSPPTDFLGTTDAQDLVFKTDGNEQMRITSSGHIPTTNHPGNVGIGTDDPQKKLHVATTHTFCTSCPQSHQGIRLENHLLNPTSGKDYVSTWDLEPVLGGALSNSVPTQSVFMIGTPGSPVMTLTEQGGNVGIGTSSPQAKLDVNGDVNVTAGHQYFINGKPFTSSQWLQGINQNDIYYSSGNIGIGTNNPYANLHVNGTVIIGNTKGITGTHSDFLLAVDGKIVSKSTFVTVSNWQDKVFSNDYIPMSLDKVEEYYTKNKHLPDYPAEKEIIDNGLDLGSTATLQQKSIEEIMLYLVDMKKQMNTLKEQNKKLENEIEKMKQEK
ncbi:MAG: hypothetical protein HY063_09990, partial [Bacteroidetes bacterium]|nr:hypothetical protein [Bacteroidota bacterium]